MKGIKLNGRFLELKPGTSTEIERKSPFFAINDFISEATTEPLIFPYTPSNALALNLPYQYYTERKKEKFEIEHYSDGQYRGKATLVIETGALDLNNIEATEIKGYLVYGISNFFQAVKGKKLSDLKLGGKRTFSYTTNNPDDGSPGYWQHFHQTWTDDTIPYVFVPVRNEGYYTEAGDVDWMNKLDNNAKLLFELPVVGTGIQKQIAPLIPFIRLKYLLEQIFAEVNYQVDFSGLNDSEWEKLIVLNLRKLDWTSVQPTLVNGQIRNQPGPTPQIAIELSKHVPNGTISDFIVQLFNRYGWAPLFNPINNVCRLVAVKEADKGTVKDWTEYAVPQIGSSFNEEAKIFAFVTDIDSNDELPVAPDFANIRFGLPATSYRFLPTPSVADEGLVRYCYHDNQWWQVQLNDQTNKYEWALFADNIYSDEPAGATETITSTISTLPVYDSEYRKEGNLWYNGLFPVMKQEARKGIGYRFLLYHGMVNEVAYKGSGPSFPKQYPFAGSTREHTNGTNFAFPWSNVLVHKISGNSQFENDFGIRKYWWSDFLNILQAGEENDFRFNLPVQELINFNWDDRILIKNIPYLVKSITEPDPFVGFIQATLKRLTKAQPVVAVDNSGNAVEGVYAKLVVTQHHIEIMELSTASYFYRSKLYYSNVFIFLYSDAAGTIPYTPPATPQLFVYVKKEFVNHFGGTPSSTSFDYYAVSSSQEQILTNVLTKWETSTGNPVNDTTYELDPAGANGYQII
jgi:hypothetical protein